MIRVQVPVGPPYFRGVTAARQPYKLYSSRLERGLGSNPSGSTIFWEKELSVEKVATTSGTYTFKVPKRYTLNIIAQPSEPVVIVDCFDGWTHVSTAGRTLSSALRRLAKAIKKAPSDSPSGKFI
jgi:hypothetical protein